MSESPATFFGMDALAHALGELRKRGVSRPLLLSGPSARFVDEVERELSGMEIRRFTGAKVHVPGAVVEQAEAALTEHGADALVSIGGGSATGLGKALRLSHELPFVAIPTTYAGSEMTRIYGITRERDKQTGRDDRVRPDAVAYVPAFLDGLPGKLTVQSLLNAFAHPISALSTGKMPADEERLAITAAARLFRAVVVLAEHPRHAGARQDAARGASAAAQILDAYELGEHHKVAHRVGGRFDLPHAAVHSTLVPHSLADLARTRPETFATLMDALPEADPLGALFDALRLVDAPTSLMALDVDADEARQAVREAIGDRDWVEAALLGRRPSVRVQRVAWDHGPPMCIYGDLESAHTVVLAIHGRGATSDSIVVRAREVLGDAPGVAVVAPQSPDNVWATASFRTALAEQGPRVAEGIERIAAARAWIAEHAPTASVRLFGFSQGACMGLLYATQHGEGLDAIVAIAGAMPGPDAPAFSAALEGVPALLGVSENDRWLDVDSVRATEALLREAGADATTIVETGRAHAISGRQRIAARPLLSGQPRPAPSTGLFNAHEAEALPGALPREQNSPRHAPYGLYPEQISGTGFIAERHHNRRTWVYRARPAAGAPSFESLEHATFTDDFSTRAPEINLTGHAPLPWPEAPTDFVDGIVTYGGAGSPALRRGCAIHLYAANRSMEHRAFYDADGDLLVVPQSGELTLLTELGVLELGPGRVAIVPRGIRFSVLLHDGRARGWIGEAFGRHFELPPRGVVGANGLADERHFVTPSPWFEERFEPGTRLTAKLGGKLYETTHAYTPYDVGAWHGNYTPFVYDLSRFSPVSNVAFDHIDPSAYIVLSAPLDETGADSLDFVVFPPRTDATRHTFRPPFFHRNVITEFNGVIREAAPEGSPFPPGVSFLTPPLTAHGVLDRAVERAIDATDEVADRPHTSTDRSLWFQFETALPLSLSRWAAEGPTRIADWPEIWGRYRSYFDPAG